MPVAITTGGLDTLVPPTSTLRLAQTLSEKQRQVHLIHRPQGGHSTDYADATEAFDFVCTRLSKARETSPLIQLNQEPGTIVCLGDSVTGVYYHSGGTFAYPELLELGIRQAFPDLRIRVINAGISGNTTQDGLARLDQDVLAHQPNLVTISFGLNDMTRIPEQDFEANLKTLAERCRQAGSKVLLCTPNSVLTSTGRPVETLVRYCDIIRSVGHRMQIPVCDQYSAGESLRRQDARTWRLMLSDEIHPNLDGHRMMADELCHSITGKRASLHDMQLPLDPLTFTRKSIQNKQPVRVLAIPPFDEIAVATLRDVFPEATFEVTRWDVAGKSLHEIELSASALVRPAKPTLVVIAIPDDASAENEESFIHAWTWAMNWSLSFGHREWDCIVVHPNVARTNAEYQHAELVRTLVRAQGVPLIDRPAGSKDSKDVLFQRGLKTNE
jgi:lysophospholipase L1-like esterase